MNTIIECPYCQADTGTIQLFETFVFYRCEKCEVEQDFGSLEELEYSFGLTIDPT